MNEQPVHEIIVYSNPVQKAFWDDPAGFIGGFAVFIPWFFALLALMLTWSGVNKISNRMYRNQTKHRILIERIMYMCSGALSYFVYKMLHHIVWGF